MKRDELWLEKIKKQLNDYSEPIPQDGWEKLQQALSEVPQATPSVRKQKLIPIRKWSVVAAAAAVLVGVSLVSLWLVQSQWVDNVRQDSISLQANTSQSVQLHPEEVKQQMIDDIDVVRVKESQQESVRSRQIAQVIPNVLETIEEDIDEELATQEGDIEETAEPERKVEQSVRKQKRNSLYSAQEQYEHVNSLKKHKSWSVGLSINSTGGATNLGNEGGVNIIQQSPNGYIGENISFSNTSTGLVSIPEGQELVFKDGMPYLRTRDDQITSIEHKQPISFGFSLRKDLAKGFSLETGLTYTYLASDVVLGNDAVETEQKLHYLGIPLRVNWTFLDLKSFTLYVSAGGMVEKCIYGKLGNEKQTVKPLQLSAMGAVGAQYNVSKKVGIYFEPGLSYYFDDGSTVQTIRKERPCTFTLQAGVRLTY